ncbi:MAG TPA: hypothetical protein VML94_07700 [Thermoplasmata archaeon]|nr:hypothetical protein [Thermoplasmata archaeon]
MAKKARRRIEEEEAAAFEFPVFDEVAFVTKEFELASAVAIATILTLVLGTVAWALTRLGLLWYLTFLVGIVGLVLSPFLIQRLRERSDLYTKGDWAGLIALEFFGFLALWFVLANLTGA